jgi:hypothetical protein
MARKEQTAKLDGREVPLGDILEMKTAFVSDGKFTEVRYRVFEPCYAEIHTLLPFEKGYALEKRVRRHMNGK